MKNNRRYIALALSLVLVLVNLTNVFAEQVLNSRQLIQEAPAEVLANPTNQTITVDGVQIRFRAYNIAGYNYFKLRDLAYVFSGTKAQFDVGWDQAKFAINLETDKPYKGRGEGFNIETPHISEKGLISRATIYKNGLEVYLLGYTINGYTYFRLRDLGQELGFGVKWEEATKTVVLSSDFNEAIGASESEKQRMREIMLALINNERVKEGLKALTLDNKLTEAAEFKALDMQKTEVLSHEGSYGGLADLMKKFNITFFHTGENILVGATSAEQMFDLWWNSPGHKANMMNPNFGKIGIGFANEKLTSYGTPNMRYWAAQEFTD